MTRRMVGVADIALALAVPCCEADLDELRSHVPPSDFLREISVQAGPADLWDYYSLALGDLLHDSVVELQRLGVTVVERADGTAVARLLKEFRLVGIFAHHPNPPVTSDDVISLNGMMTALASAQEPALRSVHRRLGAADSIGAAVEALNRLLDAGASRFNVLAEEVAPSLNASGFKVSRLWLDTHLPALRPAACIELWKTMLTPGDLLDAFPTHYDGALDLMVCNSVLHAEIVRRKNPGCLVIACSFALARLASRMIRFTSMCRVVARHGSLDVKDVLQAAAEAGKLI